MSERQKIVPCLWFESEAEGAVRHYCSIFPGAEVLEEWRAAPGAPVISVRFRLAGQEFIALNGNASSRFTEANSYLIRCEDQAEVDRLWAALLADGGEPSQCGWLKDKYGVSWQIVPSELFAMIADPDPARAKRAVDAMLTMVKLDLAALRKAHAGR